MPKEKIANLISLQNLRKRAGCKKSFSHRSRRSYETGAKHPRIGSSATQTRCGNLGRQITIGSGLAPTLFREHGDGTLAFVVGTPTVYSFDVNTKDTSDFLTGLAFFVQDVGTASKFGSCFFDRGCGHHFPSNKHTPFLMPK
jgi:hypothetical protein